MQGRYKSKTRKSHTQKEQRRYKQQQEEKKSHPHPPPAVLPRFRVVRFGGGGWSAVPEAGDESVTCFLFREADDIAGVL